jgi:ABC-2 type transport system ATP-binding protein
MPDDVAIKVENVSKTFRLPHEKNTSVKGAVINFYRSKRTFERQEALKDVSFEVKKGEFFGIVGRNGSGKSTLLKLLAGIYSPSKGAIHVNGKLTPFIELGVGFSPELTGRENVFLNGALLGFNRKEMNSMYNEIVAFAELERFMDQKLKNYSSGMQVRLAFSIAIQAKSDILVLDEVLAVGDEGFQQKCFKYFGQLKKDSKTVIFVTHDMNSFKEYCDRGILIDSGKIVYKGEPILLSAEYQMLNSAKGLGAVDKKSELSFDDSIQAVRLNGESTTILKRSEDLEIDINVVPKSSSNNVVVGVSIVRSDDVYVAFHDSRKLLKDLSLTANKPYRFKYKLKAGQFMPGAYRVDIALYDGKDQYIDLKSSAGKFVVVGEDKSKAGIVNMQGEWSCE